MECDVKNDWNRILKNIWHWNVLIHWKGTLRGGISYIAKRYSEAGNKYMENYDFTKSSIYIEYPDMDNFGNEWLSSLWWI